MKLNSRLCFAALCLFAAASPASSADKTAGNGFPNRPVRIIVPFPPGGSNDILSRYLGIKLGDRLMQQVVIDNRGGANGIIGTDIASHSTPDGYNLLIVSTSYVLNAAVRKLPYDVEKSFDPITTIGQSPNCIVVNPGWGVNSLRELAARAKAKPASIFYASTGIGGFNHFGGELFKKVAKIDLVMVPYKGGGPAMIDVMAGQIPMMFSSLTQALPHIRSGKLKVLAVGAAKRNAASPDTPTVAEAGFPGYEMYVWWGFVVPAGVPAPTQDKLRGEIVAILKDPVTQKRLAAEAAETKITTPAEMRKMIHEEIKKWTVVAKQANIHVQ